TTEKLRDQPQAHREWVHLTPMNRKHPVLVTGECSKLIYVLPYALVRRVEQVGTIAMHLDPGFRFLLGVGVATEVITPFHHQHPFVQLGSGPLGHRKAKETGTDNHEIISCKAHVAGG